MFTFIMALFALSLFFPGLCPAVAVLGAGYLLHQLYLDLKKRRSNSDGLS